MIGWAVAQYKMNPAKPTQRYCVIEDYAAQIIADAGAYRYVECLGNSAVVKVRASAATLQAIAQDPIVTRFAGVNNLGDSLAALTDPQWAAYRTKALSLGYPAAEWDAAFPLAKDNYLLRDVVVFMLRRRITPRWDTGTSAVVLDGAVAATEPVDAVANAVADG